MKTAQEIIDTITEELWSFDIADIRHVLEDGEALAAMGITDEDQEAVEEAYEMISNLKQYIIRDAIRSSEYGPKLDFDLAYFDDYTFFAESDDAALKVVEGLQDEHDNSYQAAGASNEDYSNAPLYAANLYEVDVSGDERKI